MSFSKDSKQKLTAVAAVIIVALLGINAFLLYNNYNQDQVINTQKTEINEAEQLKAELEKQYYEALSELEEMRGSNDELNAMIDQQKIELKDQKDKISRLIRSGNSSKADLATARTEMEQLKVQLTQYISENNKLKEEKEILAAANQELTVAKTTLESEVASQRTLNNELSTVKATLMSQNDELTNKNLSLSEKVNIASVVRVSNVQGSGWKIRKNGKAVNKKKAGSIDRIKVCFTALSNEVVAEGVEKFYIRVLNPKGETLAVENLGSGVVNINTEEDVRFTKAKEIDYNQEQVDACMLWEPNVPFEKGEYKVEIYNKGFLAGQGAFSLK